MFKNWKAVLEFLFLELLGQFYGLNITTINHYYGFFLLFKMISTSGNCVRVKHFVKA